MARFICEFCGRGKVACPSQGQCLSEKERTQLCQFILEHGRTWRARLREEWGSGSDLLRQVRNIIGPSGLSRVRPGLATMQKLKQR